MPILVRNIRLGLEAPEDGLAVAAAKRLRVPVEAIRTYAVVRRSLDARKKDDIHFSYQVELDLDEPAEAQRKRVERLRGREAEWLEPAADVEVAYGTHELHGRPVVVGFGPGGMFAALRLAELGYRPLVLERGRDVRRRHRDILQGFYQSGEFDGSSNLLFGEGGAGTYSDGKLYTRIRDPLCRYVLEAFYRHGADPDILIDTRPHIGSDRLPTICTRIRQTIESLGGEIRFECHVDDITIVDGRLEAVHLASSQKSPGGERIEVGPTILAVGHSARDTARMLHRRGVAMESKPFQIGVRVEHPQAQVDRWQYGQAARHRQLGPAEYHMVARKAAGELGDVFSFCMCPGGMILPTNESPGLIATNGASRAGRSSPFANSGLVLTMDPKSLSGGPDEHPALAALSFLEACERRAFEATGGSYRVPAQRACDFLAGKASDGTLETSYPLGGQWCDVGSLVPDVVARAVRKAIPALAQKFPGFDGRDGLITAPETRASGPVRLVRDRATRQAVGVASLFPVGEGAGYAGGIVSAAVDGIKSADAIVGHYAPPR